MQIDACGTVDVGSAIAAYVLAQSAAVRASSPVARVAVVPAWEGGGTGLWAIDHVPTGERIAHFLDHDAAALVAGRLSPAVFGAVLSIRSAVREDLAGACLDAGLGYYRIRTQGEAEPIGVYGRAPARTARFSR